MEAYITMLELNRLFENNIIIVKAVNKSFSRYHKGICANTKYTKLAYRNTKIPSTAIEMELGKINKLLDIKLVDPCVRMLSRSFTLYGNKVITASGTFTDAYTLNIRIPPL